MTGTPIVYRILVDELRVWPHARHRCFMQGSAHLTVDDHAQIGALDALHRFAQSIGLKRSWFQPHMLAPHYDLSPAKRDLALAHGAVFVSGREQARARIERRATASQKAAQP